MVSRSMNGSRAGRAFADDAGPGGVVEFGVGVWHDVESLMERLFLFGLRWITSSAVTWRIETRCKPSGSLSPSILGVPIPNVRLPTKRKSE